MTTNFDDVGEFHHKFGLHSVTHDGALPIDVSPELIDFRTDFLEEELAEFRTAAKTMDIAGMFDALIDLVYVAMGTAHVMGLPWEDGWDAVQRANMSKERAKPDGSNSVRHSPWDVVKPEGWLPPDIKGVLELQGWAL